VYTLLQCACGGMFLAQPPAEGSIDPTFDPHPDYYYRNAAGLRLDWITRRLPRRGLLVEIGSGTPFLLKEARRRGFAIAGIERNRERGQSVAKAVDAPVETEAVERSTRPDASCDLVYHCDLLSHLDDPGTALRRMRRMLRPDGHMAFEVGIVGGLDARWYREPLRLPHHRFFFSEAALVQLLQRNGFEPIDSQRFGLAPAFALARLAAQLRLGGGSVRRTVFDPAGHYVDEASGTPETIAARPSLAAQVRGHAYLFARYRIGALVPYWGSGTAFVLARPI